MTNFFITKLNGEKGKIMAKGADEVVLSIKQQWRLGYSPVKGGKKFIKYKDPKVYPNKMKPSEPVNLFLTGDLYDDLQWRPVGNKIEVGFFDSKQIKKALNLISGEYALLHKQVWAGKNNDRIKTRKSLGKPRPRAIFPVEGQKFNDKIQRDLLRVVKDEVKKLLALNK